MRIVAARLDETDKIAESIIDIVRLSIEYLSSPCEVFNSNTL